MHADPAAGDHLAELFVGAVRKVSGKSASKEGKFSTWIGPEITVLPTELKAVTPGCSGSVAADSHFPSLM